MSAKIALRPDFDATQLRTLSKGCSDPRQTRRLLALAAVYDGMSRADAAKVGGMDRQTLRDWVHRFNEHGPDGLTNRRGQARRRRLSEAQMKELAETVETGPDPAVDGVVRWRRVDLKQVIEERFGVVYCERISGHSLFLNNHCNVAHCDAGGGAVYSIKSEPKITSVLERLCQVPCWCFRILS